MRRRPTPRQRLLADIIRVDGAMGMILADARRLDAIDTVDGATSRMIWLMWRDKVAVWSESEDPS